MSYEDTYGDDPATLYDAENPDPMWSNNNYDDSSTIASSVSTKDKRKRFNGGDAKSQDKGLFSVKRIVNNRPVKLEYYHTRFNPGAAIRNAVTGIYEPKYRVGSMNEKLFFKVTVTIGEGDRREPDILFYDSPEQYEKHFMCVVSESIKQNWNDNMMKIRIEQIAKEDGLSDRQNTEVR